MVETGSDFLSGDLISASLGVTIGVQRHAFDPQASAALFEFGRPVRFPHLDEIREQRAGAGPASNNFPGQRAEFRAAHVGRFFARIAERTGGAVEILGLETGDIGLGTAKMPA